MFKQRNEAEERDYQGVRFATDVEFDLQALMAHLEVSQTELARRLGVSPSRVNRMLNDSNLTARSIGRIMHALGEQVVLSSPTLERLRREQRVSPAPWLDPPNSSKE